MNNRASRDNRTSKTAGEQGQQSQQGQQGQQQGRKTTLRVTTQDGKTVEIQINGEIKKIETIDGAGGQAADKGEGEGAREAPVEAEVKALP